VQDWIKTTLDQLTSELAQSEQRLTAASAAAEKAEDERDAALSRRNHLYNLLLSFRDFAEGTNHEVPL